MNDRAKGSTDLEHWLAGRGARGAVARLGRDLDAIYENGPTEALWHAAERRLADRLNAADAPIYYDSVPDTPIGKLWVALSERGLVAVSLGGPEAEFVRGVTRRIGRRAVRSSKPVGKARRELTAYLEGRRQAFSIDVDLRYVTPFQREVLLAARGVPRGQVATYGQIARRIGRPGAARAIGQALGGNPMPIVVPCHRVLASDGSLRGYSGRGGIRTKRRLLALEGVTLSA